MSSGVRLYPEHLSQKICEDPFSLTVGLLLGLLLSLRGLHSSAYQLRVKEELKVERDACPFATDRICLVSAQRFLKDGDQGDGDGHLCGTGQGHGLEVSLQFCVTESESS